MAKNPDPNLKLASTKGVTRKLDDWSTLIGLGGLAGTYLARPRGTSVRVIGIDLTPAQSWLLVALGVLAGAAICARRLAMVFTALVAPLSLLMVIVSAVAATHHDPGPFGFTAAATVLYAVIFCANLATGMWLIPNHLEGPAWVPQRGKRGGGS